MHRILERQVPLKMFLLTYVIIKKVLAAWLVSHSQ